MKKVLFVLLALTLVLSACGPAAAPAEEAAPVEEEAAPVEEEAAPAEEEAAPAEEEEEAAPAEEEVMEEANTEIVVAMVGIPYQLDPLASSSLEAAMIWESMWDSLFYMNEETLEMEYYVATDSSISEDGLTWTYTLREDVYFHDGVQLTAEDVKYSLDRMRDESLAFTGNTQYLNSIMNVDHVDVIDEFTVAVTTTQTVPALAYSLEEVMIQPKHYYESMDRETAAAADPLGSGPYIFEEFILDQELSMVANADYWNGAPEVTKATFRMIPEPSTAAAELATGGADLLQMVPSSKYEEIRAMDNAEMVVVPGGCRVVYTFNHADPRFADKEVRQAMNYSVDWDAVNDAFYNGAVPRMPINVNPPWTNEDLVAYPYDMAKVDELMTSVGWAKNDDGFWAKDDMLMEWTAMTYFDKASDTVEIMVAVADMFRQAGFNVTAEPLERSVALDKMDAHDIGPMLYHRSCTSFEGEGDIHDLYSTSSTNYGEWANAEVDALIDEVGTSFDPVERGELLDAAQAIIFEEAAQVWLYRQPVAMGIGERLDYTPPATGRIHLAEISFK